MKNIIIAFLFCLPLFSQAQIFQDTGYKSKGLWATSILKIPTDTLTHKQGIALKNGILYIGNGTSWVAASAGASGAYLLIADTASMLSNYARKAIADSSFFKSIYGKRTQSGRFVFNKTALAWDSLRSLKITDSTRSPTGKLYGHETKIVGGFEEAAYDSLYISRIKVNAATGVELSFSDQNNSDTNNIVKVDANGFTINIPSKGVGKVLQSDVNGNATWATPAGGGGGTTYTGAPPIVVTGSVISADTAKAQGKLATFNDVLNSSKWTTSGANIYNNNTGNVGIGTATPADKFQVEGVIASGKQNGGGDIRSYQDPSFYVSLTTAGGKSGLFRNNTNFFSYYSTVTGSTYMDATFSGSSNIFLIQGVEKMKLDNAGNLGIGTASPSSTLSTNGSIATTLVNKTANYTVTAADNTINVTTAAVTITLPTAVGIQGREYTIINSTSGNITITTTASQTIGNFVTTTSFTLATDKALKVQSDNTNYKIKGQF